MRMGYKRAGDILIDQAAANVVDRANVIYAALFCYRQAIELSLKRLIDEFGKGKVYSPKNTHDLGQLWERFIGIVNERGRGDTVGLSTVQTLVAEMHDADQKSDGFRFPTDTAGAPFVFGDRGIDLVTVREVMQERVRLHEDYALCCKRSTRQAPACCTPFGRRENRTSPAARRSNTT